MFIENKLKAYVNLRTLKVGKHSRFSRLPAGMATAKEIQTAETLHFLYQETFTEPFQFL